MSRLSGRPAGHLSIAVITHYTDTDEFRRLTEENMRQYCLKHNYDLIVVNDFPALLNDSATHLSGFKFEVMAKVLQAPVVLDHRLYDWVLWADQDTLFLNHRRRLEEITDNRYDFIMSTGWPEEDGSGADSGDGKSIIGDARHFMVKNSPQSHEILGDLARMGRQHCGQFIIEHPGAAHTLNGQLHICNADGTFWNGEVGMLLALYTFRPAEYRCRFKKINNRIMNSQFPGYEDGDLAVAFPDHLVDARKRLIALFLEYADFGRGKVDRRFTDKLDPIDPGTGDWQRLEDIYDRRLNIPCVDDDE